MGHQGSRSIGTVLGIVLALLGLVNLALAAWPGPTPRVLVFFAPPKDILAVAGSLELVVGILLGRWFPRLMLLAVAVSAGFAVCFPIYRYCMFLRTPEFTIGEVEYEPRNGSFRGKPNTKIIHIHYPDYAVTYTHDEEGYRVIPAPTSPKGDIYVFGCSFTYGTGVEDDESWPAILARDVWREYRVRNFAIAALGTADNLIILGHRLAQNERPRLVVFGWSAVHLGRNYLRATWWNAARPWHDAVAPHFEVENGSLVFKGMAPREQWLPPSDGLGEKEIEVSIALIKTMAEVSRANGCRFVLVSLDNNVGAIDDLVLSAVADAGIDVIDARQGRSDLYFPNEKWHGTPAWHRAVADAVARDPRIAPSPVR